MIEINFFHDVSVITFKEVKMAGTHSLYISQ